MNRLVQNMETSMKTALTALALALTFAAAPATAFNVDASGLFPTLSYPDPAPQPVTQGAAGIGR
jgi:hypothetical protein